MFFFGVCCLYEEQHVFQKFEVFHRMCYGPPKVFGKRARLLAGVPARLALALPYVGQRRDLTFVLNTQ